MRYSTSMMTQVFWIDHDKEARERTLRLLELFETREARDELGLGAVRDSLADQLFPGTSTIQTRLRYFFFVPWIYQHPSVGNAVHPGKRAADLEKSLILTLVQSNDDDGVIGKRAGMALQRLPSAIYWAGLGSWGIRRVDFSHDEFHARWKQLHRKAGTSALDTEAAQTLVLWDPELPPAPPDFPEAAGFALTTDEALYLQKLFTDRQPESLLAHLASTPHFLESVFSWELEGRASFPTSSRTVLAAAEIFSKVLHGASLLYNYLLTEKRGDQEAMDLYRERIRWWEDSLDFSQIAQWEMPTFWRQVEQPGHRATETTKLFVERWKAIVLSRRKGIEEVKEARDLIIQRESSLKGGRSRFRNDKALAQWQGASGANQLWYRWPQVKTLLTDLYRGLGWLS